jgi:hypothetical protein
MHRLYSWEHINHRVLYRTIRSYTLTSCSVYIWINHTIVYADIRSCVCIRQYTLAVYASIMVRILPCIYDGTRSGRAMQPVHHCSQYIAVMGAIISTLFTSHRLQIQPFTYYQALSLSDKHGNNMCLAWLSMLTPNPGTQLPHSLQSLGLQYELTP